MVLFCKKDTSMQIEELSHLFHFTNFQFSIMSNGYTCRIETSLIVNVYLNNKQTHISKVTGPVRSLRINNLHAAPNYTTINKIKNKQNNRLLTWPNPTEAKILEPHSILLISKSVKSQVY